MKLFLVLTFAFGCVICEPDESVFAPFLKPKNTQNIQSIFLNLQMEQESEVLSPPSPSPKPEKSPEPKRASRKTITEVEPAQEEIPKPQTEEKTETPQISEISPQNSPTPNLDASLDTEPTPQPEIEPQTETTEEIQATSPPPSPSPPPPPVPTPDVSSPSGCFDLQPSGVDCSEQARLGSGIFYVVMIFVGMGIVVMLFVKYSNFKPVFKYFSQNFVLCPFMYTVEKQQEQLEEQVPFLV